MNENTSMQKVLAGTFIISLAFGASTTFAYLCGKSAASKEISRAMDEVLQQYSENPDSGDLTVALITAAYRKITRFRF